MFVDSRPENEGSRKGCTCVGMIEDSCDYASVSQETLVELEALLQLVPLGGLNVMLMLCGKL